MRPTQRGFRLMTAGMRRIYRQRCALAASSLLVLSGCTNLRSDCEARRIPEYGIIAANQPREMQMASLPPYIVSPTDELEINVRPTSPDLTLTKRDRPGRR